MQSWEKVNHFLTSAFSSPCCRVTKEGVKHRLPFWQRPSECSERKHIYHLADPAVCMIESAWGLESFSFKRDLCHRNWVLPTFYLLTKDALTTWPLHMRWGGKIKIYICKMYFMMENKVQDCCGWKAFGCHMLAAKAVLIASMQETGKFLITEEELNRCQIFITNLFTSKSNHVSWKAGLFLSKIMFQ